MNLENFIKESIEKNEAEARNVLLEKKKRKIEHLSNKNGLPPLFKRCSFENYNKSFNVKAYTSSVSFVENFPKTSGLLFLGPVGLGKTHLASSIIHELNNRLYSTFFGNIFDILGFIKSTYNKDSKISEMEAIDLMTKDIDLLVIDDLGKETTTDHNLGLIYNIINKLYENEKSIVVTTNISSNQLRNNLGERGNAIISRLSSMCTPVIFYGKDMRVKNER